jgi:cytosolic carboxypeptidase protein 2/3
VGYRASTELRK